MTTSVTVIPPARRRAAGLTGHHQRQCKSNSACDQQRTERIVLHGFRHAFWPVADRIAAVLISVLDSIRGILGVVDRGIGGVARGVLGLAVKILHGARGLARAAFGLRLGITGHAADGALNLTGKILRRTSIRSLSIAITPCFERM